MQDSTKKLKTVLKVRLHEKSQREDFLRKKYQELKDLENQLEQFRTMYFETAKKVDDCRRSEARNFLEVMEKSLTRVKDNWFSLSQHIRDFRSMLDAETREFQKLMKATEKLEEMIQFRDDAKRKAIDAKAEKEVSDTVYQRLRSI